MQFKQKKSKKILLTVIPLGIIAVAAVYIFVFNGSLFGWQLRQEDPSNINLGPPTEEEANTGTKIKEKSIEQNQGKPTVGDNTPPAGQTDTISVGFSAINQNEGMLQIRVMIQEVLSEGTCVLTLSQNGKSVTKTADVYPTASISTCRGFDVATSELNSGSWDITVEVTSGERKGHAATNTQIN
ncbi:hypothetical protein PV379_03550 [Streptomyces caniscabiei]|uniref:hypothetical protein n=1 Tax=Streptomyces caniscabiei TaxID=2746961 RepID=UPI0029A9A682|nr:hypothetical protein [Streptomyces caniscabiei]MDX2776415.1 hypothetical protein [Streptomyces caniscabiei]